MSESRGIIAHFVRGFLRPTESFIYNQIREAENFTRVVFCHHVLKNSLSAEFPSVTVGELLPPSIRPVQNLTYTLFRTLNPWAAQALAGRVRNAAPHVFHIHYLSDAYFFLPLLRRYRKPTIVSGYGWDVSQFPRQLFALGRRLLQPVFEHATYIVAMSEDMKRDIIALGCPERKVIVHYYGTDVERFRSFTRSYEQKPALHILFCASLLPKKGPDQLLRALRRFEELSDTLPEFRLTIVGDGPLRNQLEKTVSENDWRGKVEFKGHIQYGSHHLIDEYANADVFVLPSRHADGDKEGIPGTLIEAMASGLPCVSTMHAGIPEVVTSGVTGLLVPENDDEALTHALMKLFQSKELRTRLGTQAALHAGERLSLRKRTEELERLYSSLIPSRASSEPA